MSKKVITMLLKYIMGAPSTGKSKFCLDKIINLEKSSPSNILLIVPEQSSLQAEKELINRKSSIIKTQALSFQRLSFYIFSELGCEKKILLEDIGKNMLLRKILADTPLNFFTNITKKSGFIDNLGSIISDFYKYQISLQKLNNAISSASGNFKNKLADLYLIYKKYTEYISEKYLSLDEMLDILAEKIPQSKYLYGIKIFFDGFDSFNLQEYKVIEELMKKADTIFFTAGIHINQGHGIEYKNISLTDPYYQIKSTINYLSDMARQNNYEIAEPISFKKIYKDNDELEFLVNNYFYVYATEYTQPAENIFLHRANDLYEEIEFVAKKIIHYVKNGLRFKDIAIITGNLDEYSAPIERIFNLFAIPFFIDKKVSVMTNQLVAFIRAALDVIIFNFSYESVFCFLKTNLLDIELDDIDLLENYVLEFGIKGDMWKKDWTFMSKKYDQSEINRIKNFVCKKFDFLAENLSLNRKYKVIQLCKFIFEMLNTFNVQNKLLIENADENLKVWQKICIVFDKIVDIFGDEKVSLREFAQILDEGLKKIDLGVIPEFIDQIIVGGIERSRIPNVKVLFVVGANEGNLSALQNENAIINDEEKNFLHSINLKISENRLIKLFKNNFLLYGFISKPSYQLNITCSLKSNDEKSIYPDEIFNKISSLFPYINNECDLDFSVPQAMLNDTIKIIYDSNRDNSKLQIYNWFRENSFYAPKIKKFENAFTNNFSHTLNVKYDKVKVSVTELENFARCPFAHFLKYNLKLRPRKIYQLKSVDIGSFLHAVLKEFFSFMKNHHAFYLCKNNPSKYIDLAIQKCDFDKNIFFDSAYYEFLLYHAKNVLLNSITAMLNDLDREKYLPTEFEHEFKNVKLAENIFLNGKIDRIDLFEANGQKYLRVIDYKSGEKNFSANDVADGLQLQLLMYLKILSGENVKPAGAFYFHLSNPFVDINDEINDADLAKKINEKFKMNGIKSENLSEMIDVAYSKSLDICHEIINGHIKATVQRSCAYCPYYFICREERDSYAN